MEKEFIRHHDLEELKVTNLSSSTPLAAKMVNTIRFLAADAVQNANSGHPGLPMGAAAMAYTLWTRFLRHNPANPSWPGRDRFILSGGHGSMLLYALLHLTGYDLPLDELKQFRQWGSRTPGHPEFGLTPGVEVTTGPLGQGFANGVGMALAAKHLGQRFNRPDFDLFDQKIFAIVTDGDLMEGVAAEAASLAGHLHLGNLVYLYDDNQISIDGSTDLAFSENRAARFEAYGWHVRHVTDGHDVEALDQAIREALADPRPSLLLCKTIIGQGLPSRQGTSKAHSDPPGWPEIQAGKQAYNWPLEPPFYIPDEVLVEFRQAVPRGAALQRDWDQLLNQYQEAHPALARELLFILSGDLPKDWETALPVFPADDKGMASRVSSGKVINALAPVVPGLVGGSADLTPSNKTWIDGSPAMQALNYFGRNIHFGVREHAMGAIANGMCLFNGIRPFVGTFLAFVDYMRPAVRLAALSHLPVIFVYTHDSIGVGEDGPTHQPVEQVASLRAMPNLLVIRPADANETAQAWRIALQQRNRPTALILTRQDLPTLNREIFSPADGLRRGGYVLADIGDAEQPDMILMASGSEVSLIVEAGLRLAAEGICVRLVSFPSWALFEEQTPEYRAQVLPPGVTRRLAVEAGVGQGWDKYLGFGGSMLGIERFGASAPAKTVFENYGFTIDNIVQKALALKG